MNTATVTVKVIGECEIALGRTRVRPDSTVLFAMLLHMAVRAGERVTRAELLELLWAGIPDASRRHSLRQLLYRVRRAGVDLDVGSDDLKLGAERASGDVGVLLADGWADTVPLAEVPAPSAFLRSYEPGLTTAYAEWVDTVRSRVAAQIRRASLRHIATGSHEGRWPDVELAARRCLEADPLNEEATLALAEATAMSGSKAEALRILDAYLWEIGDRQKTIGLPASRLRRRISDQPTFRVQRAGDPPLIARAEDLAWLNTRAETVKATGTCTAMLLGAPGIGKTAVMRTFVAHAEMRGWRSAVSRLQPSDVDRPMSVFVELLPSLLSAEGALGAAPESIAQLRRLVEHDVDDAILANKSQEAEAVQARIRTSALDLLAAITHEGPLILVLEDLHWIDRQSLRLLTWLIEHATDAKVLWLMTARMEGRFPELRESLPAERVPGRMVEPLSRESATALFHALAPGMISDGTSSAARSVYDVTGGNPLFIREVAGHWTETGGKERLPTSLTLLIRGRVGRLSPSAQRVLHCCAVLGRFATVSRVSTVLQLSTSDLLACIGEVDVLGLLGLGGEPGSLAMHDLWQEELVGNIRPASRALLHLRCGEELEIESHESKLVSVVSEAARHLFAAGVRERALRILEVAAEHLMQNGLAEDAVSSLDQALAMCTTAGDRLHLEERRIAALLTIGGWRKIADSAERVLALAAGADRTARTHSALELVAIESTMLARLDLAETIARARRCVETAHADTLHRATAARLGARAASNTANAEALRFFAAEAGNLDVSSRDVQAEVLAVETVFHTDLGSVDAAIRASADLVETERTSGAIRGLIRALRYSTVPLRIVGDFQDAIAAGCESYELAVKHHLAEDAAGGADIVATMLFEYGELDAARTWLDRAEPWVRRVDGSYARTSLDIARSMIALELGNIDAAIACSPVDLQAIARNPIIRNRMFHLSIMARVCIAQNDHDRLRVCVGLLRNTLERARPFRRNAYFVASLAMATAKLESPAAAKDILAEFIEPAASSRFKPWRELQALG